MTIDITQQKVKTIEDIKEAMRASEKGTWTNLLSMEENNYQFDLIVQHMESSHRPSLRLELCKNGAVLSSKRVDIKKFEELSQILEYMLMRFKKEAS